MFCAAGTVVSVSPKLPIKLPLYPPLAIVGKEPVNDNEPVIPKEPVIKAEPE